jgi:serine phosphatase RsbU (regulator of sigma subunit)
MPGEEDFLRPDPSLVPEHIARRVHEEFGCPAALYLLDLDYSALHPVGVEPGAGRSIELQKGSPLSEVVHHRLSLTAQAEEWHSELPFAAEYVAAAPLTVRDSVMGVLLIGDSEPFGSDDLEALERLGVRAGCALYVADLYTDSINRLRRKQHPSVAAELQQDSLPPQELYTPKVGIAGAIEPAYDIGGDWFDYSLSGDRLFVAVCDAVGRGIGAAAVATLSLGAVRNARRNGASLPEIMRTTHRTIIESTGSDQFATIIVAELDLESYRMAVISAGHPAPILVDEAGDARQITLSCIHPPIGSLEEDQEYVPDVLELEPNLRVIFFSDGVPERRNARHEPLGTQGLIGYAEESANLPPFLYVRTILQAAMDYGDEPLRDDATILSVDLNFPPG